MRSRTRKVEARFHPPFAADGQYVVVGRIVADPSSGRGGHRIELSTSLAEHQAPASILSTLRHLVARCASNPVEGLQALRSRYWSFVPLDGPPSDPNDGVGLEGGGP